MENTRRPAVSRRGFLRAAGAVAGGVALGGLTNARVALGAEEFPHYPNRFGILTDTTKCIGCRLCETACAQANGKPAPSTDPKIFDTQRRPTTKGLTVVNRYLNPANGQVVYRKEQCLHCDEPACVSACLVKALKKTPEGAVTYDENLCMGCRYCMIACPFSLPSYEYDDPLTPKVTKCPMCFELIRKEGGQPACVAICPTKATIFGKRADLLKVARERIVKEPGKYVDHIYGEKEVGGTGWLYLSAVPFANMGLPANTGTTAYPEFTRDFLLAVPVAYVMIPPTLAGIHALAKRREKLADGDEAAAKDEEAKQ
ncbi:MAG: 4Fe-4S dicluster domain-containing protein [Chloroflexota bacterium]